MKSRTTPRQRRIAALAVAALLVIAGGWSLGQKEAQAGPQVKVWKSPRCGCCGKWVEHLRRNGFEVEVTDTETLAPVKQRNGVPYGLGSCHTATIEGYTIEGHVPANTIRRLLAERPQIRGLAVPGMPAGSPGMESPRPVAYEVLQFSADGRSTPFERVMGRSRPQ